mgnify:CR=1 FL=1|tara:strand:+ start:1467 stop:2804 length:1338 start_codon:yes stop_codon:yes gene_type:complete
MKTERAVSNAELYEFLKSTCRDGLPYMNTDLFTKTTEKWTREVFRSTLADFITREKPNFPYKTLTHTDLQKHFYRLKKVDYSTYIHPVEQQKKEVLEKYDDYKYSYAKYGMGLINAPSTFNESSDYFHNEGRMDCGSYGFTSPVSRWNSGDNIWGVLGPIWRGVNDSWELTPAQYMMAFRLGTYIATQFKPIVAKCVYEMTSAKRVLDTSMGWGDRLCGFFASNATTYIGCDPNPNTFEIYKEQAKTYSAFIGNTYNIQEHKDYWSLSGDMKTCHFYRCGAEDMPWDTIRDIDCAFTSPPYFSTERYNEGGEHAEDQSWAKFSEYESWRDDFYLPVSQKTFDSLRSGGHMWINIMDPKIKGTRYYSSDELVDMLSDSFIGQVGMRIMQRPQGKSVFSDENGDFDKEQMDAFMNKTYIENVWCFQKDKSDLDVFRHKKITTMDEFL